MTKSFDETRAEMLAEMQAYVDKLSGQPGRYVARWEHPIYEDGLTQ